MDLRRDSLAVPHLMPRMLTMLITVAAVLYLAFCAFLFTVQRSLIYYPVPRDPRAPLAQLTVADATINLTVRAATGPDALLYFGGNAEDVSANLDDFVRTFPDHALYLMHYRGYGGSTGRPSEAALHADAEALFDHVQAAHPRITVIGRSLGSGIAVRLARVRAVERLVLVTPFDSLLGVAAAAYPLVPVRWLLRDRYESWRHAPHVTAPVTLIAAERDTLIPPARAQALFARFAPGRAQLHVVRDADHNSISARPGYLDLLRGP